MGNTSSTSPLKEVTVQDLLSSISAKLAEWSQLVDNMKTGNKSLTKAEAFTYLRMSLVDDMDKSLAELKSKVPVYERGHSSVGTVQDQQKHEAERLEKFKVDKLEKDIKEKTRKLEELLRKQRSQEDEIKSMKAQNHKLRIDLEEARKRGTNANELLQKEKQEVKKEREAKTEALKRLSEVAGYQLQFNNPAIADLSDPCRPTNIAEMYNQLYDDEWTTAYGALCDSGKPEKESIQLLKQILMECMKYCLDVFEKQYKSLEQALKSPEKEKVSMDVQTEPETERKLQDSIADKLEVSIDAQTEPEIDKGLKDGIANKMQNRTERNGNVQKAVDSGIQEQHAPKQTMDDHSNEDTDQLPDAIKEESPYKKSAGTADVCYVPNIKIETKEGSMVGTVDARASQMAASTKSNLKKAANVNESEVQITLSKTRKQNRRDTKAQSLYPEVKQDVQGAVRKSAPLFVHRLQSRFLLDHKEFPQEQTTVAYISSCVAVCWLMVIQKPQMALVDHKEGDHFFNKELYKFYTKSGKNIDFVVWPPLALHKDGAVMCKGVAQCTD